MTQIISSVDSGQALELSESEHPFVQAKETEQMLGIGMFAMAMHIAVSWLVVFIMWPIADALTLVAWGIFMSILLLWQALLMLRHGGITLQPLQAARVQKSYNVAAAGIGLGWGFCSGFLFPVDDLGRALFLVFVVGGMAMSSVASQHFKLRMCLIQISVGMMPIGVAYGLSDLPYREVSGLLLFAYTAVLFSLAIRQNRFAVKAIKLQILQDRLLKQLSDQTEELRQARNRADDANASKSRFLAQASHDLRQPLHAMSLFVESLPALKDKEQYDNILGKIRQSLDILTKLFDSLLDVTMLDTGGIEVKSQHFRVQDILDQLVSDFSLVAQANNVDLRRIPTSATVNSDPVLVTRMLQNLISNAIRHAPGSRCVIGCRRRSGGVSLIVADDGPGISTEDQSRIFEEFERLDAARMGDMATPGLGLGLSIVHRIASEMGLDVSIRSAGAVKATIFELSGFSTVKEVETLHTAVRQANTDNLLDGMTVYILDDNVETLDATALLLRKWGCNAFTGSRFEDFPKQRPDLMICDYEISTQETGIDVLQRVRRRHDEMIPAVMISGHNSVILQDQVARLGLPLLHKPLRPAPLRSALLNAVTAED